MDYAQEFTVERMCRVLKVSKSGYYKWRENRSFKMRKSSEIEDLISIEYEQSRCTYGSPRITLELNKDKYICSKSTVARYMKRMNIAARNKKKFKTTTDSNHDYEVFSNLLNREFSVDTPATVWVSDVTYIRVASYWIYLTVVIDLADRMVVGWSLSKDMSALNTVIEAFNNACKFRRPSPGFIFHSDRGSQYACEDFTKAVKSVKGIQSMSRKGNCWDNAVAESFFKTIKLECIYRIKLDSFSHAFSIIFDYIDGWYNTKRRHSALDGNTPIDMYLIKSRLCLAA